LEIRQALEDKAGIAESYNNIGWLHFKKGDAAKGISNGLLALEHGRESQAQEQMLKSYDLLSLSYKKLGDYQNALTSFNEAIAKNSGHALAHYGAAIASARLGNADQVVSHLTEAAKADPSLKEAALSDLEFSKFSATESFRNALK